MRKEPKVLAIDECNKNCTILSRLSELTDIDKRQITFDQCVLWLKSPSINTLDRVEVLEMLKMRIVTLDQYMQLCGKGILNTFEEVELLDYVSLL